MLRGERVGVSSDQAYVMGVGCTAFGPQPTPLKHLALEAGRQALVNAGIDLTKIDRLYLGNFAAGLLQSQQLLAPMVAAGLGLSRCAASAVEGACASGGIAFHLAVRAVESGQCEAALAIGVEKMTAASTAQVTQVLVSAMDQLSGEPATGLTFPGFFALLAQRHMEVYGTTLDHLAAVALKNRMHAQFNPRAQFYGRPTTQEEIRASRLIASPFRLFDCSPISDGSAAAVVVSERLARQGAGKAIRVAASVQTAGPTSLQSMSRLTSIESAEQAAKEAYGKAGIRPEEVNVAEVHDCFTAAEIIAMEDLGFCPIGEGGPYIASGETQFSGSRPVNLSGGLLSKGHPVGATGLAQVFEVVRQLRGDADRVVPNARVGLTHNVGGTGGSVVINILMKE